MKTAFTIWQDRIAPVFDVASRVRCIDFTTPHAEPSELTLPAGDAFDKVGFLAGQGIRRLVCGAISRPVQMAACQAGIEVIGFVAGEIDDVISACRNGSLHNGRHSLNMPGCGCRRRQCCGQGRGRHR
ncbi:MAG: hypothetical protein JXR59_09845 [Desulfuromonadaceae bacterium]|nr:hypothetical protein [Desulfuromonadaceae bacterium]